MTNEYTESSKAGQPCPRYGCFAGTVEGMVYMFGGRVNDYSEKKKRKMAAKIDMFDFFMENWSDILTKGYAPILYDGVCVSKDQYIYMYGGWDGCQYYNCLNRYDTVCSTWTEMPPPPVNEDFLKKGYGMVTFGDKLALMGFHSTAKLYIRDLKKDGAWSSHEMGGMTVPSSKSFSLTMINSHQAIMFGGIQDGRSSNDAYIIDLSSMECWKIAYFQGSLPVERSNHAAVCLGFGGEHPQLLISGGLGNKKVLNDLWILDVNTKKWRKVILPPKTSLTPRHSHVLAHYSFTPGDISIVLFGGISYDRKTKLDATELLTFDIRTEHEKWTLKNIAAFGELGSNSRLREKMKSFCDTANKKERQSNARDAMKNPVTKQRLSHGQLPNLSTSSLGRPPKPVNKEFAWTCSLDRKQDSHDYCVVSENFYEDLDGYMITDKVVPMKYPPSYKLQMAKQSVSVDSTDQGIAMTGNACYGAVRSVEHSW